MEPDPTKHMASQREKSWERDAHVGAPRTRILLQTKIASDWISTIQAGVAISVPGNG